MLNVIILKMETHLMTGPSLQADLAQTFLILTLQLVD